MRQHSLILEMEGGKRKKEWKEKKQHLDIGLLIVVVAQRINIDFETI